MERGEERFPRRRKAFRDDQKAVPLERKASLGDDENRSREHRRSREDHEGCAPDPDRVRIQDPFASPLQARQRAEDPGLELGQQLVGMKTCRRHAGSLAPSMWAGQPVATRQGLPRGSAVTRQSLTEPFPFSPSGLVPVRYPLLRCARSKPTPSHSWRRPHQDVAVGVVEDRPPQPGRLRLLPAATTTTVTLHWSSAGLRASAARVDRVVVVPDRGREQLEPGIEEVGWRRAPPTRTTTPTSGA